MVQSSSDSTTIDSGGGDVEYIDQGDKWLIIDNRGPVQKRRTVPKSIRDVPIAPHVREQLEEEFQSARERDEDLAEVDPLVYVPPAETYEEQQEREQRTTEALARADQQRTEGYESVAKDEVRSRMTDPVAGSETRGDTKESTSDSSSINATDAARTYAEEKGIDLSKVQGTGSGGSITKPDVEAYESSQD